VQKGLSIVGAGACADGPTIGAWRSDREQILARYLDLLRQADSPLLASAAAMRQVEAQLYNVVDDVAAAFGMVAAAASRDDDSDEPLSESIGRSRAEAGIHPSQSLQAASLIFEAALPTIAGRLASLGDATPELTAGRLLNGAILERMAVAARAYVDLLLDKAHGSNRDERRRLSRELHDVAAPAVALGLQNLELYEVYIDTDPAKAAVKLAAARQSMLDALATIRNLSAQSRENVGVSGLQEAIRSYLSTVPTDIATELNVQGDLGHISLAYSEELYLIVREAVRNAVDHGQPRHIRVEVRSGPGELFAQVRNDGVGFSVQRTLGSEHHVGLDSMRERADLLGARLTIKSAVRTGTTVSVSVSLPSAEPAIASRQ
jgi:signal transduction histidine kinase